MKKASPEPLQVLRFIRFRATAPWDTLITLVWCSTLASLRIPQSGLCRSYMFVKNFTLLICWFLCFVSSIQSLGVTIVMVKLVGNLKGSCPVHRPSSRFGEGTCLFWNYVVYKEGREGLESVTLKLCCEKPISILKFPFKKNLKTLHSKARWLLTPN